jgi:outer membrane biosynthesis protein TonB
MTEFDQLIQKWLDGRFTARDERAMRVLIDNDSDAREALEGFLSHAQLKHSDRLLLSQMPQEQPEQPFYLAYGKYLIAAASIALLVSAWWLFQPNQVQQTELATTQPAPNTEISVENESAIARAEPETNKEVEIAANQTATKKNQMQQRGSTAQLDKSSERVEVAANSASEAASQTNADAKPTSTHEVKDFAVIETAPTQAPSSVRSKASAPAPSAPKPTSSPKFETDKKVIVEESQVLEPEKGWAAFESYLHTSLEFPKDALSRGISGSVRLAFSIDDAGKPYQVRVVRSLSLSCDVEAIRLLTDGPKWKPAGYKNASVEIKFPR